MREQLERLLARYAAEKGIELREALPYLVADLRHICDRHNLDFPIAEHLGFRVYRQEATLHPRPLVMATERRGRC